MSENEKSIEENLSEMETPKPSWLWIKNSKGLPSVSVTFVTIAFWVTTLAYIASIVGKVGPVEFRQFDVGACGSYMIPMCAMYFGRRWLDSKYPNGK